MKRNATARIVLHLLAITGVVVSAIVAKQATVARQSAFASPPMLDVSLVDRESSQFAPRASIARKAGSASTQEDFQRRQKPASSQVSAVANGDAPSRTSLELPPNFVGPPEPWRLGLAPVPADFVDAVASDTALTLHDSTLADPVTSAAQDEQLADASMRWFHGRPVRPKRVLWMRVTAYSPDERSCPGTADGRTATMHCVSTNNWHLVAADPLVLPLGSMLSVPGYGKLASGEEPIVPVLDIGGAIKGERLDVLFPTHEEALRWGVKDLPVVIWEYADGQPFTNPRHAR